MRKRLIFSFAIKYIDENRDELTAKYPDFEVFNENFQVDSDLLKALEAYASENKIEITEETPTDYQESRLKTHLKALIASDLWETNEFYQVNNEMNESVQRAIIILNDESEYQRLLMKID
jgi:carboxyl-terminal processing protease